LIIAIIIIKKKRQQRKQKEKKRKKKTKKKITTKRKTSEDPDPDFESSFYSHEVKFEPTTPNMSQHVATWWPNARNMLPPAMLQYMYVALTCCARLAGA